MYSMSVLNPASPHLSFTDPQDKRVFTLKLRHFIVISTTVTGGIAVRNSMIPALAEQLIKANEDDELYTIFLRAHNSVQNDPDVTKCGMVPECRSTLTKKLCLKMLFRGHNIINAR